MKYINPADVCLFIVLATLVVGACWANCGCGGNPFIAFDDGGDGGALEDDAAPDVAEAAVDAADAGAEAGDDGEAAVDAPGIDAPGVDAPGDDVADDHYDAPVCVTGQPFGCNGDNTPAERVVPPGQMCYCAQGSCGGQYGVDPTPPACATCETYTCACIEAVFTVKSCSEVNGQITVVFP